MLIGSTTVTKKTRSGDFEFIPVLKVIENLTIRTIKVGPPITDEDAAAYVAFDHYKLLCELIEERLAEYK